MPEFSTGQLITHKTNPLRRVFTFQQLCRIIKSYGRCPVSNGGARICNKFPTIKKSTSAASSTALIQTALMRYIKKRREFGVGQVALQIKCWNQHRRESLNKETDNFAKLMQGRYN